MNEANTMADITGQDEQLRASDDGMRAAPTAPYTYVHLERIARVCHEANLALCQAFGDNSQLHWPEAPEWQRQSAISGVEFHVLNPDASASASHDAWSAHKVAEGWTHGPVKDAALKQHPCLVPFNELPPEQQAKDFVFRAIVHAAMLNAADER